MFRTIALKAIPLLLLSWALGSAQQSTQDDMAAHPSQRTLWVTCDKNKSSKHVLSPVSLSEDSKFRAYVEVDVNRGCLYTTRLWVAAPNAAYRLLYLMPPERTAAANGMEILGWAARSRMFLVKTEQWQIGSDAPDRQRVLAIDAGTGMVYEPELGAILQTQEEKQCALRVTDAGFASGPNVDILIRAKLFTALEQDETEQDLPREKRCGDREETWSFDYSTGEVKLVANSEPGQLVKKFLSNQRRSGANE